MASEVDICNVALGHLGDSATVASIDPPEGSAQAEHCARFYPIARDSLLERHAWGFATTRAKLALLENTRTEWDYCYAYPSNVIKIISVLPNNATDDYGVSLGAASDVAYFPQPYSCEVDGDGNRVIYTDQKEAVLRYVRSVTDTTTFSPLFTITVGWELAAMLAGPVIKGEAGAAEAKRCMQMVQFWLNQAMVSDANQSKGTRPHVVSWMAAR